jgi:hypothetical protein
MKRWVTLIIFFTVPFCLYAQYSIGIKRAPVSVGKLDYPNGSINDSVTVSEFSWAPVAAGAYFNYTFTKNFSIQTEIKPTVESLAYRDNETEGGWFEFTFIEMPFLFQYKGKTRLRGFADAGLVFKFLMLGDHYSHDKHDARIYFNDVALKGSAGGGIMFDINKHFTLIADTRMGYDFTPIGKRSVVDNVGKEWAFDTIRPLHITMISFGVAYKF